jgi:hypothetical protein
MERGVQVLREGRGGSRDLAGKSTHDRPTAYDDGVQTAVKKKLEAAAGFEPAKPVLQIGASSTSASPPKSLNLIALRDLNWRRGWESNPPRRLCRPLPEPIGFRASVPKIYTQNCTQNCTQTALVSPIYTVPSLSNLLKPRTTRGNGGSCRPLPYHLATAPPDGEETRLARMLRKCPRCPAPSRNLEIKPLS